MNRHSTKKYDRSFRAIEHFKRQPQMMPWVGAEYTGPRHKTVLFIGESHYLPQKSTVHKKSSKFYACTSKDLTKREVVWTNTRDIIASVRDQICESRAHRIFSEIEKAILGTGFKPHNTEQMLRYAAFYNFFQRPGQTGQSIKYDSYDREQAARVFTAIAKILRPSFVCVVSALAWRALWEADVLDYDDARSISTGKEVKFIADFFPHPGCRWWNSKAKTYRFNDKGRALTGREKLLKFLTVNRVFSE